MRSRRRDSGPLARAGASAERPPEPLAEQALLAALRAVLEAAEFADERLARALGAPLAERSPDPALDGQRLAGGDAFATLGQLFYAGVPVRTRAARPALAPLRLEDLERGGLVRVQDDFVHARMRIEPHRHLLVASDRLDYDRPDRVIGVDASAARTAHLTVPVHRHAMLDLGTGGGVQALLAAPRSDAVIGTDVNRRALRFAATNERLNGVANVTWRHGSWFEPVVRAWFDLIVANLPFAVAPDASLEFRESGLPGDTLARRIVREAVERLTPGGVAQVQCAWICPDPDDWAEPLREWVAGTGADALFLHTGTVDVVTYAGIWNRTVARGDPHARQAIVERWLRHYESSGIEAIAGGMVVVRRRPGGRNWTAAVQLPRGVSDDGGEHVLRLMAAQDLLADAPDERALLAEAFAPVDGLSIEQATTYEAGRYRRDPAVLRPSGGLGVEVEVDPRALDVLFECDGRRSLAEVAADVAADAGEPVEQIAATAVDALRRLYEHGLVARADTG